MKDNYVYPAIFSYDYDGVAVSFPDLPGCNTCGADTDEAIVMAKDALGGHLLCMAEDGDYIPPPSNIKFISTAKNERILKIGAYIDAMSATHLQMAMA